MEKERDMTEEDFESAIVTHGADTVKWPESLRADAAAFAETHKGKSVIAGALSLDRMMTQAKADIQRSGNADMFLAQLNAIPEKFDQPQAVIAEAGSTSWTPGTLIDRVFDPARFWSPVGLVSQGVFASVLLFAGLMVGINAAGTESLEDYDISAGLFESSEQDYSIDG